MIFKDLFQPQIFCDSMDVCITSFPFSDFLYFILGKFRSYEDNKNNGHSVFLMNRLLVDYRVLQYRCRHLALGMQLGIAEEIPNSISVLSNAAYLGVCVWGHVLLPVSKGCQQGYLLNKWADPHLSGMAFAVSTAVVLPTVLITVLAELPEPSRICFVQLFPPTFVRNLTLGWCFHNRQSQICFDFALYHHCAEQSAHQFLLV